MSSKKADSGSPMNDSHEKTVGEKAGRARRRRLPVVIALIALLCVGAALALVARGVDDASSEQAEREKNCCWAEGATPEWLSGQVGIRIPEGASDRRAGYKTGQRYDTGLLTFVLPRDDAEGYLGRLVREGTRMVGNIEPKGKDYRPAAAFGRLGLPEPETFAEGVRRTTLCPDELDSPEGRYLQRCVDLFAHDLGTGAVRVYVRSVIEPSVTPPAPGSGR
ncbi:hypothetical protein ACH4E8_09445 [Streptomyces sp. NPDC017979]|uniref:hypothetical protein n=1 Tax=Streptomyces sp. NPDC017979 TaxID=3365024 RepID=UPI00378DFE35